MATGVYYGTTYQQIQQAVADYYGSGSDAWARIYVGAGGYYSADAAKVIQQVPGVTVTYSNSGKVLGYDYRNPFATSSSAASAIDSNIQTGAYGTGSFSSNVPSTYVEQGGQLVAQSGSKVASTGATLATVADRLSLAAVGVSLGTKLGKSIDELIYSTNPQWWDEHYPTINPETWDDMATTEGGKQFIRTIFGLQDDSTTMYVDERMLAQTYMMLLEQGAYEKGVSTAVVPQGQSKLADQDYWTSYPPVYETPVPVVSYSGSAPYKSCAVVNGSFYIGSTAPFTITLYGLKWDSVNRKYYLDTSTTQTFSSGTSTWGPWEGKKMYYATINDGYMSTVTVLNTSSRNRLSSALEMTYLLVFGDVTTLQPLDGVQDDPRAQTYIDPSVITGTTPEEVLQQLKDNYPELFDGSIYQDTPQPDGSTQRITYIPVPIPDGATTTTPTTGETSQTDPSVNPDKTTDDLIRDIIKILTQTQPQTDPDSDTDSPTSPPNPPDTGDGDTPIAPLPTGSASSLWRVYNPTQGELDSFGAWLWSSDLVEQIKKLFSNPMESIIGVHKVFANPSIGGTATIKCGYIDSGVSSKYISDQYSHIDCGTVNLPEYFGNVFDYDPFTKVSLFLPFIGIVPLNVADVMRSSITVKYHVDVITGACLAEVSVKRDGAGGILYTYSGSAIVSYPLSSGSYAGIIGGVLSIAAGIAGTIATEGAMAPALLGAASSATRLHTTVQRSGDFSGAPGAMGGKIPYLIITRPQTRMADNYPSYDGVGANFTSRLSACSGYVRVKEVHLKVPDAYESEIKEIESLLHSGILI